MSARKIWLTTIVTLAAVASAYGVPPATQPTTLSTTAPTTRPDVPSVIVSGAAWSDQNGDLVQLHGIGLLRWGDVYFAYGQDARDGEAFHAVATYSSRDLVTWTRHADALAFEQSAELGAALGRDRFVVERPKVLYNEATRTFVMLFHFDSTARRDRYVGVATCDRPDGRFAYVGKFKPQGNWSADMGVFVDPNDGQAYLIGEDRVRDGTTSAARTLIYKLNDDYTDVRPDWHRVLPPIGLAGPRLPAVESPTMVYDPADKLYYLFGSLLTGWGANDNVFTTTPSLEDPTWSPYQYIAKPGLKTHGSQVSFVLPVHGSDATSYVFIGDRWLAKHLWDSPPIVLPIALSGGRVTLDWHDAWSIDLRKGTWRPERVAQTYKAVAGEGGAVAFDDVRVPRSATYALELTYRNADPIARFGFASNRRATVSVDGGAAVRLSFPVTTDPLNPVPKAIVRLPLEAGRANRVELVRDGDGAMPEVDALGVYDAAAD